MVRVHVILLLRPNVLGCPTLCKTLVKTVRRQLASQKRRGTVWGGRIPESITATYLVLIAFEISVLISLTCDSTNRNFINTSL
jgi:hypothetical protein